MFSLNLQERQASAIQTMLNLNAYNQSSHHAPKRGVPGGNFSSSSSSFSSPASASSPSFFLPQACSSWKILIFDDLAKNILAPLMTVGMLRRQGVTLNLPLRSQRSPVIEAPAVYLLAPTEENVQILLDELQKKLYAFYFFNFTDALSDDLMQLLAKGAVETGMVTQVVSVVERYVDFVCFSPFEFSLNKPKTFSLLNSQLSTDGEIEECLNSIVNGLFCVIATLGVIPIVRCPASPSSPARTVAMSLQEKIVGLPQHAYTQVFGYQASPSSSSLHRPLLILLDREFDLSVMVRHTWLYQALIHDVLLFKLNRVTVESVPEEGMNGAKGGAAGASPALKTFDLDSKDKFWMDHSVSPFPEAALAVSESLAEYNAKIQQINQSGRQLPHTSPASLDGIDADRSSQSLDLDPSGSAQGLLTAVVSALPGMTERKRVLDAHTCIATALVDRIKARGLDAFFEVEQTIDTDRESEALQNVRKLLSKSSPGTAIDKLRLLLTLFLNRPSLTPQQIQDLEQLLKDEIGQNFPTSSLDFLRQLQRFKTSFQTSPAGGVGFQTPGSSGPLGGSSGREGPAGGGGGFGLAQTAAASLSTTFLDKGRGLLQGVKNFLPARKTLPITQVVESLMENSSNNKEDANFLYLDPARERCLVLEQGGGREGGGGGGGQSRALSSSSSPPLHRMAFRHAVAFVLGGGSFVESAALRELSTKLQKQVLYGSTDFVSPCDFVAELTKLGGGGGAEGGGE